MTPHNIRRTITETYDPKQRIVGGIVLVLLMLLIYSILKLVLGFSSASEDKYQLPQIKQDEVSLKAESENSSLVDAANNIQTSQKYRDRLPKGFAFLALDGTPMQPQEEEETYQANEETIPLTDIYTKTYNEGKWYVQVAAFRTKTRAQRLVRQIQANNIASTIHIIPTSSGWYLVRLPPEEERSTAQKQSKQLQRSLHLKPIVKQIY